MKKQITTATLPPALREQYEIVGAIPGGPRVALPQYGMGTVDFSTLKAQEAERLIVLGFPYLRHRLLAPAPTKASKKRKRT